ncbi:MAG: cation diffusion facilitator family transporter [Rickettsiella sp.]|nr:cation diffusion facilitator family transporter [Rickettsiella sp.]
MKATKPTHFENARYQQVRSVGLWGGVKNIFLALFKIIFGITGHSHALFADGIHSLSDLLVDSVVIVASKFGSKAADEDHPYGHGRIETAATVFLALVLAAAAFGIIYDAVFNLIFSHITAKPATYVLWIAVGSIGLNEALYYWTKQIAMQTKSKLLMSNAWHHRSDSASSLAVALAVMGASLGFPKLDALAAIVVGLMILKIAWDFGWHSIRELVDTVANVDDTEKIKLFIKALPGVKTIHQLRTRSIAGSIFCDVHVLVDPQLSVSEGHYIGQAVESRLTEAFPDITDVTVHIDTEDDEVTNPSYHLPHRAALQALLEQAWHDLIPASAINTATLHYKNGNITIELKLPLPFSNQTNLLHELKKIMDSETFIKDIKLFYYKIDE